jgi:hypothetical protein
LAFFSAACVAARDLKRIRRFRQANERVGREREALRVAVCRNTRPTRIPIDTLLSKLEQLRQAPRI